MGTKRSNSCNEQKKNQKKLHQTTLVFKSDNYFVWCLVSLMGRDWCIFQISSCYEYPYGVLTLSEIECQCYIYILIARLLTRDPSCHDIGAQKSKRTHGPMSTCPPPVPHHPPPPLTILSCLSAYQDPGRHCDRRNQALPCMFVCFLSHLVAWHAAHSASSPLAYPAWTVEIKQTKKKKKKKKMSRQ